MPIEYNHYPLKRILQKKFKKIVIVIYIYRDYCFQGDSLRVESYFPIFKKEHLAYTGIKNSFPKCWNQLLSFLVSTSIFVSLALFFVLYFSFLCLGLIPHYPLFIASSLVTFSVYNLNKITDQKEDTINNPQRAHLIRNIEQHTGIALSLGAYVLALIIGLLTKQILSITILLIPLWIAILYSVPLSSRLPRLKDIFFAKSLSVALGMSLSIFLLLYIFYPHPVILLVWVSFLFIKLFINTVLFDVRDLDGDKKTGINTLPVTWGIRKTKNFLLILNSLLIIWIFIVIHLNLFLMALPIIIFSIVFDYWSIQRFCKVSTVKVHTYDIVVDGEWIILCGMLIVFNFF